MKTRLLLALLCVSPVLVLPVFAQNADTTQDYKKSWAGVAKLATVQKHEKTRDLFAVYPVFTGRSEVERVAGDVLKRDALKDYNAFEKESRGSAEKLGLSGDLKYDFELAPTLELRHLPRLLVVTTLSYSFEGGAHGYGFSTPYNFGFPHGGAHPRLLRFADFFTDGNAAKKRIGALLFQKLRATKGKEQEATWTLDGTVKAVDARQIENFVVTRDGLRWFFPPYAMGPYSSGEIEVPLSRVELGRAFRGEMLR